MKVLALAAVLALAGCGPKKTNVEYAANMDLGSFQRVAVMPFTDQKGRGRLISETIAKGLPARGFETPDAALVQAVFAKHKPDADFGMGVTMLADVRQTTKAQAILAGAVSPNGLSAAVILIDTDEGNEIFKGTLIPQHRGAFKDAAEIADQALNLFAELPKRAQ